MERPITEIRRIPLLQLVMAAYATLSVETMGYLFGQHTKSKKFNNYSVEGIQTFQLGKNKPASVEHNYREVRRIKKILEECIGGFHSHPTSKTTLKGKNVISKGGIWLSNSDKKYMLDNYPEGIEVIMGITPSKKTSPIRMDPFGFSATLEDRGRIYKIELGVYCLMGRRKVRSLVNVEEDDLVSVLG